ncbi:hypothetical protein HPB48_016536 [Haemaphysalis longicornis]|uniref:Uncharacterized protein n=1 Tax=Haemaphysalis longicornis TaxID=44386 RepID=A0A9J6GEZ7_HAELO|nr:hypothetical protein HPB48_016536 [Haemaphysalis longicornis]
MNVLSDDEDAGSVVELSPEDELLQAARSGSYTVVENLLNNAAANKVAPNVDCKGECRWSLACLPAGRTQKANLGWTPLHLACYFGHFDVAELLLEVGMGMGRHGRLKEASFEIVILRLQSLAEGRMIVA